VTKTEDLYSDKIKTYITKLGNDAEKLCFNEAIVEPNNASMVEVS